MNKLEKLKQKKEEIEKQIKQLEEAEKLKDYQEVKNFRIYKWENKPVQDFLNNMPKGYRLAEFQEFIKLIEDGFKLEVYKYYFVKHFNKLQWNKEYCLSAVCLNNNGNLNSDNGNIDNSNGSGRVVVIKIKKGKKDGN